MKKILVTMLALSLAAVSTVDAKRTGGRGVMPSAEVEKSIKEEAKDLKENPDKERAMALLDRLSENPNMMAVTELELRREDLVEKIEKQSGILKNTKTGWIFNSQEYKDQKKIVSDLRADLARINKDIADKKRQLPHDSNTAIYATVAATLALGTAVALEYWFRGEESWVKGGITRTGSALSTGYGMMPNVPVVGSKAREERAARKAAALNAGK